TTPVAQGVQKLPSDTYYEILLLGLPGHTPVLPAELRNGFPYAYNKSLVPSISDASAQTLLTDGQMSGTINVRGETVRVFGRLSTLSLMEGGPTVQAAFLVGIPASLLTQTLDQLAQDLIATVLIAF